MENERVIFSQEIQPEQTIRIFAIGDIDTEMLEALKAFVEFQEKRVKSKIGRINIVFDKREQNEITGLPFPNKA